MEYLLSDFKLMFNKLITTTTPKANDAYILLLYNIYIIHIQIRHTHYCT